MIRGKTMRATTAAVAAVFVLTISSPALAVDSVLLSCLFPGLGQSQEGHYGKATIFGSAAIISWVGVFATQINYSRSVDKYDAEKATYLAYQEQIEDGDVVKSEDVNATYQAMSDAFNESDDQEKWRNMFVGALVITYGLNLVDIILSDPDTGEVEEPATSMLIERDGFRVVRTFRF